MVQRTEVHQRHFNTCLLNLIFKFYPFIRGIESLDVCLNRLFNISLTDDRNSLKTFSYDQNDS